MWELLARMLWLPLDIMQRMSSRFLHFGRSVYGGLFGPVLKPAIKPPPPKSPPRCSRNNSPTSSRLKVTPSNSFPIQHSSTSYVIDMEFSTAASASSTVEQDPLHVLETSALVHTPVPICVTSEKAKTFATESCNLEVSEKATAKTSDTANDSSTGALVEQQPLVYDKTHIAADDEPAANVVVVCEAHGSEDCCNCATPQHANNADTSSARGNKRFREKEKRRQVTMHNFDDSDKNLSANESVLHNDTEAQAKKPKLSVEDIGEHPLASSHAAAPLIKDKGKKSKKKRPKKCKKEEIQGEPEEGDKMGTRAPPPNFFIAVQISDKDILSKIAQLQKSWSEQQLSPPWHGLTNTEIFKDAMVPVAKLHFTLHVMHLKGSEDVEKAQSALAECSSIVHDEFVKNPMDLTIEGLGHFKNNVIFAQIKHKSHIARLTRLAELFREKFTELNIPVDPRPFNPHMTIAKISRSNKLYKKKIRSFPPDMWSASGQTNFGTQRVSGIQLLQMAGEDKATGYYICLGQHFFEDPLISKSQQETQDDDQMDKKNKNL